ncbi:hypothetical protein BBF93_17350 [Hyphomonas sp. CACIAM 19H1]|nr:hypothetical protein BBF93_17350 [Hyphomonas sp. CACIAM 19H1]
MACQQETAAPLPGGAREGGVATPAQRRLARGSAFKAQCFMGKAQLPAKRGNGLSLGAGLRAQTMIDGQGEKRSPLPGRPALGENQKGQGIPTAGDGNPDGRIEQASRQRGERPLKGRPWP